MTAVPPVGKEEAEAQGLGPVMDSFARLGDDDALFVRLLAHAPDYAEALWGAMAEALFEGNVDHRLKEIVRIQLANTAADPYFSHLRSREAADIDEERIAAGQAGFEDEPRFTEAERWALRYAYLMYREPEKVDAAFYDEGKQHFSEAQIMELGGLIAIHYGMQVFMRAMQAGGEP